jgi:TRIAD3 protein (E3 ubiquitin-protein ligase RNF216)
VKEARQRALEEYKHDHPEIDEEHIKIDLPGSITVPSISPTAPLRAFDDYY